MHSLARLAASTVAAALLSTGCGKQPQQTVSFSQDVKPILEQHCVECHQQGGKGTQTSGLKLTSYEALMQGTRLGPVVEPGHPASSTLVRLVEGKADPSIQMPHGEEPLAKAQIQTIRQWVAQGTKDN